MNSKAFTQQTIVLQCFTTSLTLLHYKNSSVYIHGRTEGEGRDIDRDVHVFICSIGVATALHERSASWEQRMESFAEARPTLFDILRQAVCLPPNHGKTPVSEPGNGSRKTKKSVGDTVIALRCIALFPQIL